MHLLQDLRYGFRGFVANPGFAVLAILTLALGIGPNTAIFTELNEVLLRTAPHVDEPERLVQLRRWGERRDSEGFSHEAYKDYRDHNTVFSGLMAYRDADLDLSTGGRPERVQGQLVTGNYFSVLGMRAARGRMIGPDDDRIPGGHPVAVVSDVLWKHRFAGDPQLVGKTIVLNGLRYTVIGIAPPDFRGVEFGSAVDVWLPLAMEKQARAMFETLGGRLFTVLSVVGRLKPAATLDRAQAELSVLGKRFEELQDGKQYRVVVVPGIRLIPEWRSWALHFLAVLMATASLVLLVACANVANLLLARATVRTPEIAVRLALGASRARLVRQFLTESVLLAVAGGGAGLVVAYWLARLFWHFYPEHTGHTFSVDPVVLQFMLLVSILSGIGFGLAPALAAGRLDMVSAMKGTAAARGHRTSWLRAALVVGQVAVSLVAIVVAALFVRTLRNLQAVNPGYQAQGAFFVQLSLRPAGYSQARGRQFYGELVERIAAVPGVGSVTLASTMPPGFMWGAQIEPEGRSPRPGEAGLWVGKNMVGAGYFETLGVSLVEGRGIGAGDTERSLRVAVVNESAARQFWPGETPVGKRFRWANHLGSNPWIQVVGVARDGKYESLEEKPQPLLYLPFVQAYEASMKLVVRAAADLETTLPAVYKEVLAFDQSLPLPTVKTLHQHLAESLVNERVRATLISLSGFLATLLALVGLYGVVSYSVAQRTREIGIRVALGARRVDVIGPVMLEAMRLASVGMAAGVLLSLALTRLLAADLYGVQPADLASFAAGAGLLAAVTLLAAWVPARRALRIDPITALRHE